jgi:hypothetical protein
MKAIVTLLLACLIPVSALAATGIMIKDEDMKSAASAASTVVGRATKGADVEILARQGGWTRISSAGKTGWVRILAVKSTAPTGGAGDVLGLVEAGTTKRDPNKVVAVAGLRGLNEEELKLARFDAGQMLQLDRYASDRSDAERFARGAGLQSAKVRYLPNPKKEQQQQNNANDIWGVGGS